MHVKRLHLHCWRQLTKGLRLLRKTRLLGQQLVMVNLFFDLYFTIEVEADGVRTPSASIITSVYSLRFV